MERTILDGGYRTELVYTEGRFWAEIDCIEDYDREAKNIPESLYRFCWAIYQKALNGIFQCYPLNDWSKKSVFLHMAERSADDANLAILSTVYPRSWSGNFTLFVAPRTMQKKQGSLLYNNNLLVRDKEKT